MDGIFAEQMLFGYNNGHTLINTSLKKTLYRQKDVDFISDASGMGRFCSYITCYPICEDGYYVFAKTWYAEEMMRPGCVWTHVILISFEDIARVGGKIDIDAVFQRPDVKKGFEQYGKQIFCPIIQPQMITYSKYAIYTLLRSERKVLVEDADSEKYEKPLINILTVLPTYILQKITVCTCSLANRYINNEVFDYQITLPGKANILLRELEDIVLYKNMDARFNYPLWVKYLEEKFINGEQAKLYDYCIKYKRYGREELCDLSKVFYSVNEFKTKIVLQKYYDLLKKINNGYELVEKTDSLIYFDNDSTMRDWFEYTSLVKRLLEGMQKKKGIFAKKDFTDKAVMRYAKDIYNTHNNDYLRTIFQGYIHKKLNKNGERVVSKIIELLEPDDLFTIFDLEYSVCMVLVRIDSRFLLCKNIWKQDKNFQLDLISNAELNKCKNINEILKNIVEYSNQNIADEVYQIVGQQLGIVLCDFYKSKSKYTFEQIQFWIPYCAMDKKVYIDLVKHISNFKIIYELMSYIDSYCIYDIDECRLWIDTILRHWNDIIEDEYYKMSLFVLPFVIKLDGSGNRILDEIVFDQINDKLEKSIMDFYDWKKVSKVLPEVSLEQSWDKCLRLRLAFKNILGTE